MYNIVKITFVKTPYLLSQFTFIASRSASNTPAKPKTPGGDRFIPSRMSTNYDISHFKVNQKCLIVLFNVLLRTFISTNYLILFS